MKKFLKIIGSIILVPFQLLFIMYSVPLFVLDMFISILSCKFTEWKNKVTSIYNMFKVGLKHIMKGNWVTWSNLTRMCAFDKAGNKLCSMGYSKVTSY